jgi:tetratricopeptide (TPR) repeat protein
MRLLGMAAVFAILAGAPLRAQSGNVATGSGASPDSPSASVRSLDSISAMPFPVNALHAIVLMGKVVIEGGAAPDSPVRIERVCGAAPRVEGFTDAKGNFSVMLGQEQSGIPDASETPSRGSPSQLSGCELRALLPGYRSDAVSLSNVRYMDNPNVGTIFLHRVSSVSGLTTSATSSLAPKDARRVYRKALHAESKNKVDDAQKLLQKAVAIYPKYAAAWFELGRVYERRNQSGDAREAYRQSMAADSKFINPYERLYLLAYGEGNWQEAAGLSDRVLRLNPFDYPDAYYYNAVANLRLNRLDAAEKSAREAVRLSASRQNSKAYYALGYILAQRRNYSEAAQNLKTYLAMAPAGKVSDDVRRQLHDIERNARAQTPENPPPHE